METRYVDILRFEGEKTVLLARCIWRGTGPVEIFGSQEFAQEIAIIADHDGATYTPENGLDYLYALSRAYRTPYLMASGVEKGEPPPATFE